MGAYPTLVRRELGAYFGSLAGYVVLSGIMLLTGVSLVVMIEATNGGAIHIPLTELFYGTPFFWMMVLLAAPVITMRLFAQEKFSGTLETLMTTPVGDVEVVLAKFSAAWLFYLVCWLPLLGALHLVHHYTAVGLPFDWWPTASTFLGILLVGGLYLSLGCLASALTRSQIIAAMVSFAAGVSLYLISFLKFSLGTQRGWVGALITQVSLFEHMEDFVRGVVDTRHLVFYLSLTLLCLFLTFRVVESRRWK